MPTAAATALTDGLYKLYEGQSHSNFAVPPRSWVSASDIPGYRYRVSREQEVEMYVYFIKVQASPSVMKIGKARNPADRIASLQTGCPYELRMIGTIQCRSDMHAEAVEKRLHRHFQPERTRGEWFLYTDRVARIIATIIGRPIAELNEALHEKAVSRQKTGMRSKKQRWAEYERQRSEEAILALRAMDEEFRQIVRPESPPTQLQARPASSTELSSNRSAPAGSAAC